MNKLILIVLVVILQVSHNSLAHEPEENLQKFWDIAKAALEDNMNYLNSPNIDLNMKSDTTGQTPLLYQIILTFVVKGESRAQHKKAIINLLNAGADPNINGFMRGKDFNPLITAVFSGDKDIVIALLKAGASLSTLDIEGRTALDIAKEKGLNNIVKILKNEKEKRKKAMQGFIKETTEATGLLPELAEIVYEYAVCPI